MKKSDMIKTGLNGKKYLLIRVEKDSYRFSLVYNKEMKHRYGFMEYTCRKHGVECSVKLTPVENYKFISKADQLIEKEWKQIVPGCTAKEAVHSQFYRFPFYDYHNGGSIKTAKASGLSWIKSLGFDDPDCVAILEVVDPSINSNSNL